MRSHLLAALACTGALTCSLGAVARDATPAQQAFARELVKVEPKVKDAVWMNDWALYVGVISDGTRRDGYAQTICYDAGPRGAKLVKVIDIVKVKSTGKFVELGRANCR